MRIGEAPGSGEVPQQQHLLAIGLPLQLRPLLHSASQQPVFQEEMLQLNQNYLQDNGPLFALRQMLSVGTLCFMLSPRSAFPGADGTQSNVSYYSGWKSGDSFSAAQTPLGHTDSLPASEVGRSRQTEPSSRL